MSQFNISVPQFLMNSFLIECLGQLSGFHIGDGAGFRSGEYVIQLLALFVPCWNQALAHTRWTSSWRISLLYRLCSVLVGCSVDSVESVSKFAQSAFRKFHFMDRTRWHRVDGCRRRLDNQWSVLGLRTALEDSRLAHVSRLATLAQIRICRYAPSC